MRQQRLSSLVETLFCTTNFLERLDGLGLDLILHHKLIRKAFEVMCLHIPDHDQTSFEGNREDQKIISFKKGFST
ncbi:hypothetical protein QYF36_015802 [Acer negundo]|nr:hypothetical protein QYF36_015802 [Acer negundo]